MRFGIDWAAMGIDPALPRAIIPKIVVDDKGKPSVRKITQLYGRPGNVIFPGKETVELTKGKDGVWR